MNRPSLIALLTCLTSACQSHPQDPPETSTSSPSSEARDCNAHEDCEDHELCFPDGLCAPPWGSGFTLTDLSFEGPWAAFKERCILSSRWLSHPGGGEPFHARAGRWDNPVVRPWVLALENSKWGLLFFDASSQNKDEPCPQLERSGPFCRSTECPPLEITHYRGITKVVLQDQQNNVLRFRLAPREK